MYCIIKKTYKSTSYTFGEIRNLLIYSRLIVTRLFFVNYEFTQNGAFCQNLHISKKSSTFALAFEKKQLYSLYNNRENLIIE